MPKASLEFNGFKISTNFKGKLETDEDGRLALFPVGRRELVFYANPVRVEWGTPKPDDDEAFTKAGFTLQSRKSAIALAKHVSVSTPPARAN